MIIRIFFSTKNKLKMDRQKVVLVTISHLKGCECDLFLYPEDKIPENYQAPDEEMNFVYSNDLEEYFNDFDYSDGEIEENIKYNIFNFNFSIPIGKMIETDDYKITKHLSLLFK